MKLTDDDYRSLAVQCATQDYGRIDRNDEMVYVSMDVYVDYGKHEKDLTGGHIPNYAECSVIDVNFDTSDGSEVEVDIARLEEETYNILMQY